MTIALEVGDIGRFVGVGHNRGRPLPRSRHFLDDFGSVRSKAVLGGLHHE